MDRLTHVATLHMHVSKQVKHIHLLNTFTADCPCRTTEMKVVETIVWELCTLILTTLTGFPQCMTATCSLSIKLSHDGSSFLQEPDLILFVPSDPDFHLIHLPGTATPLCLLVPVNPHSPQNCSQDLNNLIGTSYVSQYVKSEDRFIVFPYNHT